MANNQFIYPRVDECNPRMNDLDGMNVDYSGKEARLALAIADALKNDCCGGGTGGTGDILPQGDRTEFSTTIGTSNVVLFPADSGRTYFQIQNLSCELLYVRFGAVADATNSYLLHPGGVLTSQIPQQVELSINVLGTEAAGSNVYGFVLSTT